MKQAENSQREQVNSLTCNEKQEEKLILCQVTGNSQVTPIETLVKNIADNDTELTQSSLIELSKIDSEQNQLEYFNYLK